MDLRTIHLYTRFPSPSPCYSVNAFQESLRQLYMYIFVGLFLCRATSLPAPSLSHPVSPSTSTSRP